jgi:prepilin-type N-terminal cleavage/methylation domain-containing protein
MRSLNNPPSSFPTQNGIHPRSSKLPQANWARKASGKGFTLVELLVVIAIIAVLGAIGLSGLSSMLDKGGDAQDLNNLRQIGTGISKFAAENNGRIPNQYVPIPGDGRSSFMGSVEHAINEKATGIYTWMKNPLWFSKRFAKIPNGKTVPANQYYWGVAWGMNSFIFYDTSRKFEGYLNRAPNLSKLVLVGEKNKPTGHEFTPSQAPVFEKNIETSYRISRNGKAYYLFGDYHIESIEGDQSTIAHPEYLNYNPTNRLYYKWW